MTTYHMHVCAAMIYTHWDLVIETSHTRKWYLLKLLCREPACIVYIIEGCKWLRYFVWADFQSFFSP